MPGNANIRMGLVLLAGIVIGILIAPLVYDNFGPSDPPLAAGNTPDLANSPSAEAPGSFETGQIVTENGSPSASDRIGEETRASNEHEPVPPSIPSIYEDHLRRPDRMLEASDFHEIFKNELRDEPWAAAMESGIHHSIANAGSGDWAVVEYVECRSRICEIAGYVQAGQHPMRLIEQFADSGAWPGVLEATVKTRFPDPYSPDNERFIIIMSGYDIEEVRSMIFSQ